MLWERNGLKILLIDTQSFRVLGVSNSISRELPVHITLKIYILILHWYESSILKNKLVELNLYNMDEMGFLLGFYASEKVVVGIHELHIQVNKSLDSAQELIMVLDGPCIDGISLDPIIVFKTEELREGYFVEEEDIASTIMVGMSGNGWTTSALVL
ncbi:hypothetical protein L873DRAFT_1916027 [Choiromyces venosus 120613-1]|uniref:Uncharacterized protein n=1 Tax=Choiromyces venosus 120613-1 TaxID=1336337 RepID=A0A3N4K6Y8_9PEZI|nr:hypothetical protein L873DRAFT_1916027 [Choiromyces venosus 120613-1]